MSIFSSPLRLAVICMLSLGLSLVSGCAQLGEKDTDNTEGLAEGAGIVSKREADSAAGAEVAVDDDAPLVIPPNPYLENPPKVPEQAKRLFKEGLDAMRNRKLDTAKAKFTEMVNVFPELSGPYVNLGIIAERQNQHKKAEEYLLQALAVNELNLLAYNHLGVVYREQGDFYKAEQAYKDAIKTWPGYAEAHLNLAILYDMYLGRLEEALQMYKRYTRLTDSPDKRSRGWIADLERRIADRQPVAADDTAPTTETGAAASTATTEPAPQQAEAAEKPVGQEKPVDKEKGAPQ